MATRLRVKKTKMKKDRQTAHKKAPALRDNKIDNAHSKKMQKRKINRAR